MQSLVYLHGYFSSPESAKAQATAAWLQQHYPQLDVHIPALTMIPSQAVRVIDQLLAEIIAALPQHAPAPTLIGSSMGGFYANYFCEQYTCRAVLVNPAVYPHQLLAGHVGELSNPYSGETCTLSAQHMLELRALLVANMKHAKHRMVLLQSGDETLDYREAEHYYANSSLHIESGGDHSFTSYNEWLPRIAQFLQLA